MDNEKSVLFVDDSLVDRRIIRSALERIERVKIIGHASNGESGLAMIETHLPDVVFLDVQMPKMNGLEVLERLPVEIQEQVSVFLLTSKSDAAVTKRAMDLGVQDFIFKPAGASFEENFETLVKRLRSCLAKAETRTRTKESLSELAYEKPARSSAEVISLPANTDRELTASWERGEPTADSALERNGAVEVVVIAVSTGGPAALRQLLPTLPVDLAMPILVVQHLPEEQTAVLAMELDRATQIKVMEGRDGMQILPGHVYIAPGGLQMGVRRTEPFYTLRTVDLDTANFCKPSADYLLESAVDVFGAGVLAVVMTGMGTDGTQGCSRLAATGGSIITQDSQSCVVYGMPRSVDEAGLSDETCSIERIAERITMAARKAEHSCTT
ncbi:MAG: chemotaxis-specific protein-glutamate methyltransferase CheB [Pirellulaceae bacterium]